MDVENDIEIVDPAKVTLVPDDSAFFRKSKVYIESQWRSKIPTDNKIHIGNKAAMDLMSYQLEPAQMALNKTRQRILIADTVGLGKTLEAGILMSELIARGKGKRILVVTVKSMMTQFQNAVNGIGYPGSIHSNLAGVFSYSSDSSTPIQTMA